jgi:hypothetical protein
VITKDAGTLQNIELHAGITGNETTVRTSVGVFQVEGAVSGAFGDAVSLEESGFRRPDPDEKRVSPQYGTHSYLIECKVSRSDFFADRAKPFRCEPALGMGLYRYFMAPSGVLTVDDLEEKCDGWGLLEVRGRSVFVLREAKPHTSHNQAEEIAQLVQALAQAQFRVPEPLHVWLTGPDSPVGKMREQQRQQREEDKTRTCSYMRLRTYRTA